MLKAILFDIDDTLYDLSIPFKEAFREFFPGEKMDLEGAFLASRKYSDLIYDRSLSGEISMAEMYIYRLGNAFRDYGKIIDGKFVLFGLKKGILVIQDPEKVKKGVPHM